MTTGKVIDASATGVATAGIVAAAAADPVTLPWYWAMGMAVALATAGATFDSLEANQPRYRSWQFLGKVGLCGVVAIFVFSAARTQMDDSLQASATAGAIGMLGRHAWRWYLRTKVGVDPDDLEDADV